MVMDQADIGGFSGGSMTRRHQRRKTYHKDKKARESRWACQPWSDRCTAVCSLESGRPMSLEGVQGRWMYSEQEGVECLVWLRGRTLDYSEVPRFAWTTTMSSFPKISGRACLPTFVAIIGPGVHAPTWPSRTVFGLDQRQIEMGNRRRLKTYKVMAEVHAEKYGVIVCKGSPRTMQELGKKRR